MAKHKRDTPAQAWKKNITKLSGIGDEAWFDGNAEKGKVAIGGILAHKGKADFALQSAVLQYRSSLDKMKEIARRIAGKLQWPLCLGGITFSTTTQMGEQAFSQERKKSHAITALMWRSPE